MSKRPSRPNYGDNEFKGNGIIRCAACDEPLRDHPIGPCPTYNLDRIYVAKPSQRGRNQGEPDDTIRRRKYR
jgi:hypothetical protein